MRYSVDNGATWLQADQCQVVLTETVLLPGDLPGAPTGQLLVSINPSCVLMDLWNAAGARVGSSSEIALDIEERLIRDGNIAV